MHLIPCKCNWKEFMKKKKKKKNNVVIECKKTEEKSPRVHLSDCQCHHDSALSEFLFEQCYDSFFTLDKRTHVCCSFLFVACLFLI